MRVPVLHTYADHKWTGPSEPVVRLCRELSRRGWRSDLACKAAPVGQAGELAERARASGLTVFDDFHFAGGFHWSDNVRDIFRLSKLIAEGDYGIVHAHGTLDHILAFHARNRSSTGIPRVRTDHGAREYTARFLPRLLYGPAMTDHLIVLSDRYAVQAVDRIGRKPQTVTTVRGAVDADRFCPMEPPAGKRESLGLADDDVVFGVVARVQRHRRFEVLLEAADLVRQENRQVKIVVLGRGTHKRSVLDEPVAKMALQDIVFPLGYRSDDYRGILALLDAGIMLVPGSDGSCRAALQMAAMEKPLIVAERGVLPNLVVDGQTGIVVEDTPEGLAEAILEMAESAERRSTWGTAGRQRMCRLFSPARQAGQVEEVYRKVLAKSLRKTP